MAVRLIDSTSRPPPRLAYLTGFEGTPIHDSGTNILETTLHTERYRTDLIQLKADGLQKFRACIPWPSIERAPGEYDWDWTDRYMGLVRKLHLTPIVDPCHHTGTPSWLADGYLNSAFPERLESFVRAFAERYPWVKWYTCINEPYATAALAGFCGVWYPYRTGHESLIPMLLNMSRGICLVTEMLIDTVPGVRFLHTDSCEHHQALDTRSRYHAWKSNRLRFSVLDLISGKLDRKHPLYWLFRKHGMTREDVSWFKDHPARIDILGLDYYPIHEAGWNVSGRSEEIRPLGFKEVALQYADHSGLPIMLSETNIRGYVEDRITWLKYMVLECEALVPELAARGIPFEGFCWYPYIDSTDWCSMVCQANGHIDPQGIYWLSPGTLNRNASELSDVYVSLASGTISGSDIPSYAFHMGALDICQVRKFLPLLADWEWRGILDREHAFAD